MKICITGGSGFIGGYFCRQLATTHEVVILDLVEPGELSPHAHFIHGDVRDPEAVAMALEGCDEVLHLAAAHHDFGIEEKTYFDVNEAASKILCAEMDKANITRCCFYSTVAVYGETAGLKHEQTTPNPVSPYGISKLAGEVVFKKWCAQGDGRSCLVIRPTVTFGAHNFANMYSLIRQIDNGRFLVAGDGTNIKSLSYVENIVAATLYLWDRANAGFEVFNFIDKPDLTSREISMTVARSLGRDRPGVKVPLGLVLMMAKPFDLVIAMTGKNLPVSSARVRKLFTDETRFEADKLMESGFEPPVPLQEGIDRMVKWYLTDGKNQSADWKQPPKQIMTQHRLKNEAAH